MLLIYVVLFPATSLHAAEAKDCQLKRYASLDLSGLRNGYLLVPVTIQGSHAFMILNTANAFSSITEYDPTSECGRGVESASSPINEPHRSSLGQKQVYRLL
jgi:hypothetical protein